MQYFRRFRQVRIAILAIAVVAGAVFAVFGDQLSSMLSPRCEVAPPMSSAVTPEHRRDLEQMDEMGLLYCPEIPEGIAGIPERFYWASDGLNAVLYLPDVPESFVLAGYQFGEDSALTRGGLPPVGYFMRGRPIYRSAAPEGANYFFLKTGAPGSDPEVTVELLGPELENPGLMGRDFFDDMETVWRSVVGGSAVPGRTRTTVRFAIVQERWANVLTRRFTEALAPPVEFQVRYQLPEEVSIAEPTLYQVASGPLGTSVWVAGVMTNTNPVLVLQPADGDTSQPSLASTVWQPRDAALPGIASFAFEAQPDDAAFRAPFWASPSAAEESPPEHTFGSFSFAGEEPL